MPLAGDMFYVLNLVLYCLLMLTLMAVSGWLQQSGKQYQWVQHQLPPGGDRGGGRDGGRGRGEGGQDSTQRPVCRIKWRVLDSVSDEISICSLLCSQQ